MAPVRVLVVEDDVPTRIGLRTILNAEPDSLWQRVLRRQRGDLAMFAAYPEDPTTN